MRNITNLKQSLVEFNNAISHLYSASMNLQYDENINRAINHLHIAQNG